MQTKIYNMRTLTVEQIADIARDLSQGALAVYATDTVYGIGTGAFGEESVQRIYALKQRPATQPLQLLLPSLIQALHIVDFGPGALHVAQVFWPGGLTLIVPPSKAGKPLLRGSKALGLRVPAHLPLLRILLQMTMPLASTSANVHGSPTLTREEDVVKQFDGQVDYILTDGTLSPTASTVLDATGDEPHILREGSLDIEELLSVYEDVEDFV